MSDKKKNGESFLFTKEKNNVVGEHRTNGNLRRKEWPGKVGAALWKLLRGFFGDDA